MCRSGELCGCVWHRLNKEWRFILITSLQTILTGLIFGKKDLQIFSSSKEYGVTSREWLADR